MDRIQRNRVPGDEARQYERMAEQLNFLGNIISPQAFANLATCGFNGAAPMNGMLIFCTDAKSVQDGAAAGSVAVGGGTGCYLQRANGLWLVM